MKSSLIQFAIAALLFAVALGGYAFWYLTISAKSAQVTSLERQIKIAQVQASRASAARATLSQLAGDEAAVRGYFVSQAGIVTFIDDLQARGKGLGADVSVHSVAADNNSAHPAIDLSLGIDGPFDAVMRTVGAIEYAPYDLTVASLALTSTAPKTWHAEMKIRVGAAEDASSTAKAGSAASAGANAPGS